MRVPVRTCLCALTFAHDEMPALLLDEVALVPQALKVRITTEQCE
jgi:hypothetical protein